MVTSQNLAYENGFNVDSVDTLVDILHSRALYQPDKKAFTFLLDGETEENSITYLELDLQARAIAALLQSLGASGERALLLYPPGLEFITAFFGCLYAGVIAVPAYPPRSKNRSMDRIQAIVGDAQATIVLTTTETLSNLERRFAEAPDLAALRLLAIDNVARELAEAWQEPAVSSDTLAYLQYTSGSTSKPKGVMISHGNAMHNSADIALAWETRPDSVLVSWLPHFHDFGLVYGIIQPVYQGCSCVLMAPTSFIQQPIRWLQAISCYRATHSGAPNFAYELCISKITPEQRAALDLSGWCVAVNGAEPIRQEALQRFAETFGPCGFRWGTFCPGYGLAEATLKVSASRNTEMPILCTVEASALAKHHIIELSENEPDTRTLVGCGSTVLDTKIVIVNPASLTRSLPNQVGEIWVSGSSVAQGYWNRPEETEETFGGYLADTGEGPFLRTGDLGFMKDDQLFVTGRLKDLIVIRGYNHYPQDIELTVEKSNPALRPSFTAAFSIDVNGEEQLVGACEVERTSLRNLNVDAIGKSIYQAVIEQHELKVYAILLLKPGSIPKTSSGKIQRRACRAGFLAGNLDVVGDWRSNPDSKVESQRLVEEVETRSQQELPDKPQQFSSGKNNGSHQKSFNQEFHKKAQAIQAWLLSNIAQRLRVNPHDIDVREPFSHYGLDSVAAVSLSGELEDWLGRQLSPTLVYDYPTIEALVRNLTEELATSALPLDVDALEETETKEANASGSDIVIVGLGCRFPGAKDVTAFWQLLRDGVDAITEVPATRWDINALYNSEPATPGKMSTRWGGFLDRVDQFDPHFFAIAPREAERIDPQQRLLLEVAWEALENAGQAPDQLAGSQTGVFIGISSSDYFRLQLEDCDRIDAYTGTGNAFSIAANRLSYVLDLRGPSLAVDTACSSSLVAVHLACQSLQNKECNLALAGGVNLILSPELTITFSQARMMATDGRCKTFSADADGYVRGEGCGVVLLKRLSDALRDGDNILAVIKGSAINQDGRSNGLTAPNGPSQQAVIRQALENAGVAPAQISYVEAHGTGTSLGDPIEVDSLKAVLMSDRSPNEPCVLGSVKTNIGHLEAAAGIASLIKVVLSLQHEEIPPQLHLNQLNPYISLEDTSFSIPKERHPWLVGAKRRFAGVSSFGFGGTNAHVVVEEPPVPTKTAIDVERPLHLLTLSAKSEKSLQLLAQRYQAFLEASPQASIADVCFTANTGRSHFAHRLAIVSESTVQLQELLGAFVNGKQASGLVSGQVPSRNRPKIAFLFTGQGSQYVGMGRQLYETQPTFRQALERCDELLGPYLEQSLLSLLYSASDATDLLHETAYTQPALFALEYALAQLWRSWGIVPDVVMGHSLGEYVAACVAGVFSLEEGLLLVVERSRLMQSLPHDGSMAVVFASEERVRAALSSDKTRVVMSEENETDTFALNQTQVAIASGDAIVSIAAVNGPENIVISGAREAVESAIAQLQSQEITVQPLQVSHAFHSPLMAPILNEFERKACQVNFKAPRIPLISNLTGQMLKPGEIPDASYWRRHMRETVQFSAGMNVLEKQSYELFLELGPSATLLGMGKRCLPKGRGVWLPSLKQGLDDWRVLLNSLGVLEIQGVEVNWAGFDRDYQRRRVPLPTYPFERQRYWFESNKQRDGKFMDVKEPDTRLSTPHIETTPKIMQRDSIRSQLRVIIAGLLHADSAQIDVHAPFLEMGADSLVILEAVRTIETTFGVKIAIRQFFEELTTIDALATYIDKHITPEWSVKDTSEPEVESRVRSQQPAMKTSVDATADSTWKDTPQPEVESGVPSQQSALPTSLNATADALMHRAIDNKERIAVSETALERIMGQQLEAISQLSAQQLQVMSQLSAQQLQAMSQQREGLHNNHLPTDKLRLGESVASESINQAVSNPNYPANGSFPSQRTTDASPETTSVKVKPDKANTPTIPSNRPIKPAANEGLTAEQRQHLQALITRYNKRTQKSKQQVQTERPFLADSRASAGFRWDTKEMCYPIIGQHSQGARIWDVDGNEYVDLAMGFGVHLCGHHPPFITAALEEQFKRGIQIGPRSELPGEVAKLISQLTGVERVVFCNSGTESVMTALRLARTVTGRSKIVMFAGSYHGHFDGTLVTAATVNGEPGSAPLASGVPQYMADNVLVLNYGDFQSLDTIKAHAHELAAVLVEPVQSRRPDLQPKEFLQQLRKLTAETGIALIFDEVLVGFRIHPGGAQAWFGVEADLVTYGKVIGGGLPIGVVAGKAAYMNAIDGGMWNFGDASYPQAETTYFGGTFSKHPLAMATARAVLMHMKMQGATLQEHLNQRTSQLAETLNAYFQQNDVPIRMVHFGSLFRLVFEGNFSVFYQPLAMDLLFYHLLEKGVYIWEGRNCFLSTAHTDEDIEYVIRAVKESVEQLQSGGFLCKLRERYENPEHSSPNEAPPELIPTLPPETVNSDVTDRVPLTEAQKQLWFLAQMGDEASSAYNQSVMLQLQGSLQLGAMRRAFQNVVDRHEALRTIISCEGDVQQILPTLTIDVPLIDFSNLDATERDTKVEEWLKQESRQCFDLTQAPLLRVNILKLEEQQHLLLLSTHHIVTDGWSITLLLQEVSAFYSAECQGKVCEQEPPLQFKDYIQEQLKQSQSAEMAKHQAYWLKQFAGSIPTLNLPTDHPLPPVKTYKGAKAVLKLKPNLCASLKTLSKQKGCTLFMTLLAGYMTWLHRLTNQDDILVGIAVAGRTLKGSEKIVGYCTHLLPIRSSLVGFPAFSEYLTTIRHILLDAYEHQDYPFASLLNQLKLPRDPSRSPLVSATFNLESFSGVPKMFGLDLELVSPPISYAHFDIALDVIERNGELLLQMNYSTDLFEAETISRMLGYFQTLLEGIVANPEQRLSDLPLLTQQERQQLLVEWNDTQVAYPKDVCIHQLFEAQVERTPDAVAVVFEDQQLTYGELNRRANQVAHHLRSLGVGPDSLVGICVERSLEMIAGLLGILKAGGAYVPLDPAYPKDRLAYMLNDSQMPVLMTTQKLSTGLPEHQARVVYLDIDWGINSPESDEAPVSELTDENLAYVIYTSGSTGKPKGVAITHRNLVNAYLAWEDAYELRSLCTSHLQMASFSFDVFSGDLVRALCFGAKLVICPREWLLEPENLYELMRKEKVDCADFVPAVLRNLIQYLDRTKQDLSFMRLLIVGSDSWHIKEYQQFQRFCGAQTRLINAYGVSEATIDSSYFESAAVSLSVDGLVPIGRPFANTKIYILDSHLQPVPIGVAGELHIGGAGVARGYLNQPKLTEQKFIPNPFSNKLGDRLYKTGDLGRYLPDGTIEFLGRLDNQVKIRSFRIEVGEIEAELSQHPAVQQAVIVDREDRPGNKRLVAYFVPNQKQVPTPDELRRFLKEKLPDFMLPSAFVHLDVLPLTANGKVNRQALPVPDPSHMGNEVTFVPPRNLTEETLASIWGDLLGLERVGIHDDFFDLGGHSLLATQIISRLRQALSVELPLRCLFESSTIAELAELVVAQQIQQVESDTLEQILAEVDELSEDKVKQLLLEY